MNFDPRALLIIGAFLCWILAVAIEFNAISPGTRRRLPGPYTAGLLLHGLGLILISQRGLIADLWTILVANVLLLAAPLFYFSALQAARGLKADFRVLAAMPVSMAVLLPIAGFGPQAFGARVMIFTGAALFAFGLICWAALQLARAGHRAGGWIIFGAIFTLGCLTVTRAVSVASGQVSGIFDSQIVQLTFYLLNDVCITLAAFGYMDVARSRNMQERSQPSSAMSPDAQTGLYSREAFLRSGLEELNRARRREYAITLMLVRLDRVDDTQAAKGDALVDLALKRVAATILRDIRMYDVAGRLSGAVMGVIMPELALADAVAVAERIREIVAGDPAIRNGVQGVTVSAGVCELDPVLDSLDSSLAVASSCLERARAMGGNCVITPASSAPKSFVQDTV